MSARKNYSESLKKALEPENQDEIAHYQKQINLTEAQIKHFEDKREALLVAAKPKKPTVQSDLNDAHGNKDGNTTKDKDGLKRNLEAIEAANKNG